MMNKFWTGFVYLYNAAAIAQSIYFGQPFMAVFVLFFFLLSQWLVYRKEFLLKQKSKKLLDAISRIETCSPEELEQISFAMSQGMLTFSEFSEALSRLIGNDIRLPSELKECQNCQFWHGKNNIVCAVRPFGYEGDNCTDFESKP